MTPICDFFINNGTDHQKRSLMDILAFDDKEFDQCHDFIQWIFPLHEASRMRGFSPVLTKEDAEILQGSEVAKRNILLALNRYKIFLGLKTSSPKDIELKSAPPIKSLKDAIGHVFDKTILLYFWCKNGEHNLLRITRVIRSLRLFGLEEEARKFYSQVLAIGIRNHLGPTTIDYWNRALEEPVFDSLY